MPQDKNIIFIGGVHGVGKTTFCTELIKYSGLTHLTASQLIKDKKSNNVAFNKQVRDVNENQNLLVDALSERDEKFILLDGHFSLLNATGAPVIIPVETFEAIQPRCLILLQDAPDAISQRMISRDGSVRDVSEIERHQNLEKEHARTIADKLNISLLIGYPDDTFLHEVLCYLSDQR